MTPPLNDRIGWPWMPQSVPAPRPATAGPLPRISIVTPSFNQGKFIEETIRSVLLQDYPNLEYIVMDGGSTDNSVEIIKKHEGKISFWASEKDRGQSHAINKGLERTTGDIFNWINSDDLLMPGALWAVADAWLQKPGSIVAGTTEAFDETGVTEIVKASNQTLRNFVRFWEADSFGWAQQGTFVPVRDLKALGGVPENLTYCMDYQMMVNLLMRGLDVTYANHPLARFRLHPDSKTVGSKEKFRLERVPTLRNTKNLPIEVEDWEWDAEQARRLVDVARHAWRWGGRLRAMRLLARAVATSPSGALGETWRRTKDKLSRHKAGPQMKPA
jgi:glycosyltransferase involved in cell wall biosynthesis